MTVGPEPPLCTSRCSRCGAPFRCGVGDANGCWCAKAPALPRDALAAGRGCLCPTCLTAAAAAAAG